MDSLKKSNATRSLEAENRRQAQTLFGVVALFALSHVFRVVLNVHEIYLTSFNRELGPGCASNIPFWTHVRNFIFDDSYCEKVCRLILNMFMIIGISKFLYYILGDGNYSKSPSCDITFWKSSNLLYL